MKHHITALAAAALLGATTPSLAHPPAKAAEENAALDYLRESLYLTPELREIISVGLKNVTPGLNDDPAPQLSIEQKQAIIETREMIARLQEASLLPNCDWGATMDDGPFTLLPHLSPHRLFARLMHIDGIIRIEEGDINGAIANTTSIMRMAHHMNTSDSFLITKLVATSELTHARDLLQSIPSTRLEQRHREQLNETLSLYTGDDPFAMRDTLTSEIRTMSSWIRAQINTKTDDELRDSMDELFKFFYAETPPTIEEQEAMFDRTSLLSYIDLYSTLEGQIRAAWNAKDPMAAFTEIDSLLADGSFGPLARQIAPNTVNIHTQHNRQKELINEINDLITK
ncbi:MAG: hypothetical protein ACYTF7_09405 [Planctomycetota bacterium]|jgi:hypothetical protein